MTLINSEFLILMKIIVYAVSDFMIMGKLRFVCNTITPGLIIYSYIISNNKLYFAILKIKIVAWHAQKIVLKMKALVNVIV